MREKELEERMLISKEKYVEIEEYIQKTYPNFKLIHLKNRYFDDANKTIRKSRNVLRIRSIKDWDIRQFTYKVRGEDGDIEYTQPLTYYSFNQIIYYHRFPKCETIDQLVKDGVDINTLKVVTELRTRRMEVELSDFTIVLDANEYNNIVDYNIEVESKKTKEHAKSVMLELCELFNMEYKSDSPGKSSRAFASLKD